MPSCFFCGKSPAPHSLPTRLTPEEQAENRAWADSLKGQFHTGHCPHLELPAHACEEHAPFKVGDRVVVKEGIDAPALRYGVIARHVPEKGGYLVRHDGAEDDRLYGWSVHELEHAPLWPTRFERLD